MHLRQKSSWELDLEMSVYKQDPQFLHLTGSSKFYVISFIEIQWNEL